MPILCTFWAIKSTFKGGGDMVTDFSGTSILSNEQTQKYPHVATGGKKWLKKPKSKRNDLELVSFHYWTRLDELII